MITVSAALSFYRTNKSDVVDLDRLDTIMVHINQHMGGLLLPDVDVIVCRGYIEARREKTTVRHGKVVETSDATVARELGVLKAAANYCLKWKKITADQMPTFEIPANLPKGAVWLFDDELRKLYRAAYYDMKVYYFIRLLYITASRRAAIESLEWSQVDFSRKVIYLGKPGQKTTKKRRPAIPMGEAYNLLLDMYKEKKNIYVLGNKMDRYRQFMQTAQIAGLEILPERDGRPSGRITPHVLRHTRATHLLENGMSIYSVARLLGDNPSTVERVYAHASMSKLETELEKYS